MLYKNTFSQNSRLNRKVKTCNARWDYWLISKVGGETQKIWWI